MIKIKNCAFFINFIILLSSLNIFPQFDTSKDIAKFNKKKELTKNTIDSISTSISDVNKKGLFFNSLSSFFFSNGNLNLALNYTKKELDLYKRNNLTNTADYHNAVYVLGYYYRVNQQYEKAMENYKITTSLNFFPKKRAQALCEIGYILRLRGQYKESLNYYIKGIELIKKYGNQNNFIVHSVNLALTCNYLNNRKDIEYGIKYLTKAENIIKTEPELNNSSYNYAIYTSLANLNLKREINNLNKASTYYKYLIHFSKKEKNNLFLALSYNNFGEFLLNQKNDSSLYFLNESTKYNFSPKLYQKLVKSESNRNKAVYYIQKDDFHKALFCIKTSLKTSFNIDDKNTKPNKSQLLETTDRLNIIKALNTKIKILNQLYSKEENYTYLEELIETINISDQLVEVILENSVEPETQFSWRNEVSKIYNYGIYAARILGDHNLQFQYLEKNKAFLLTQSITDNNYSLNLPNHIVNKELEYKKQILTLEDQVSNLETKQLKDSLFDIKFNYQNFKDSIKLVYPEHFESKQKAVVTSLDKVKQKLDNNTVIISYSLQDEETNAINISSGLLISKNKIIPFTISNIDSLQKNLNLYRQLIAKPLHTKTEIEKFNSVSNFLYQHLFPTKEIQEVIKGKQLVIIPDNQLQNIPFEAFITDVNSNKYLIEENDVSYAYSMSFSDINNNIERTQRKEFAGFAPINFQNQKLTSLEYSEKEMNTISDNLNGVSLTGNNVTKDSFFKNATDAKIIHLATHADISRKPVIHFSSDSLNLHELYTYKNNADLVVLSACETNLGEIKKGEGILNLARGFFYSGSKSVVSSLWKVNDVATTSLMTDFYTNLKEHQSKSKALNNAKRNYLKTHSLSEKSPYYWASFILIGDTAPTFESDYIVYYFIGFFIISLLFLFFFKKRG